MKTPSAGYSATRAATLFHRRATPNRSMMFRRWGGGPEDLAINRYGQVPVLRHRGLTLVMANIILDYLARTTAKFEAATEQDRWRAREWLSWENDAITNVARVRHFSRFRTVDPAVMS